MKLGIFVDYIVSYIITRAFMALRIYSTAMEYYNLIMTLYIHIDEKKKGKKRG